MTLQRMMLEELQSRRYITQDRDSPLSPTLLLEILGEYWRGRKPKLNMLPTSTLGGRLDQPISDKTVWIALSSVTNLSICCSFQIWHSWHNSWHAHRARDATVCYQ